MLMEKAYSVRFAARRRGQRPSATTHLTWRSQPYRSGPSPCRSLGQKYRVEGRPPRRPPRPGPCRIPPPCTSSGVSTTIPTRTPRRAARTRASTHMRYAVDGIADEGDPLTGRIEHLRVACSVYGAEPTGLGVPSRPTRWSAFDRPDGPDIPQSEATWPLRGLDGRGGRDPLSHEPKAQATVAGMWDGLGDAST